jgi:hypothetical protein
MRRLFVLAICIALFGTLALPVSAASGTGPPPIPTCGPGVGPCQETDHFGELVFFANPIPGCPAPFDEWAMVSETGNGIQHINVNAAQDFWETNTMEGTATLIIGTVVLQNGHPVFTPDPTRVTYAGHLTQWFGASFNNKNFSISGTVNLRATGTDGSRLTLHLNIHMNTTGVSPFVPNLNSAHMDVNCS